MSLNEVLTEGGAARTSLRAQKRWPGRTRRSTDCIGLERQCWEAPTGADPQADLPRGRGRQQQLGEPLLILFRGLWFFEPPHTHG
jgi:hypothetical protein